jgi:hypothetical protein
VIPSGTHIPAEGCEWDIQDRDWARLVPSTPRCQVPFIERIFGHAGSQGPRAARAAASTGSLGISRSSSATNAQIHRLAEGVDRVERRPGSAAIAAWRAISSHTPNRRRHARHDPHQAATPDTAKSDLTDSRRQTV